MRLTVPLLLMTLLLGVLPVRAEPITGTIDDELPFVEIVLSVADEGSTILLDLATVDGDLDTLLYLLNEDGMIVAENNDRSLRETDSYLVYGDAAAGDYTVIVTRYGLEAGQTSGEFELMMDVVAPEERLVVRYAVNTLDLSDAGFPLVDTRSKADWTVLAYFGADSSLESALLDGFDALLAGGSDDTVRVVTLMDRHPEFSDADDDWFTTRLFEMNDGEPLAELGDVDTGSGETLAQFLVWGVRNFPADRYAVVFAGHGGGWRGLIRDDSAGYTVMSLPELRQAFSIALQTAGVERFDLLVNDASLMNSVEYYGSMSSYFDYAIAPPGVLVNPGLDMALMVETLRDDPTVAVADLGTRLLDDGTMQLTDLAAFEPVIVALDSFSEVIVDHLDLLGMGSAVSDGFTSAGDLMQQVAKLSDDAELVESAESAIAALAEAAIYPETPSHNLYFPPNSQGFDAAYLPENPVWGGVLRQYYNAMTVQVWNNDGPAFHPPAAPDVQVSGFYPVEDRVSMTSPLSASFEVTGRKVARAVMTVDHVESDGTVVRLLSQPIERDRWQAGVDTVDTVWRGHLPVVTDGDTVANEWLVFDGDMAYMDGRFRERGSDVWNRVRLVFDGGTLERIISRDAGMFGVIKSIPDGADFQSFRGLVTVDGRAIVEPGTLYIWPEDGLSWTWEPAPSGDYETGLLVTGYGGATGFASVPVSVDNDNVDATLRADIQTGLGFSLVRPAAWSPLTVSTDPDLFRSTSADGDSNYTVYFAIQNVSEDLEELAQSILENYDLESTSDLTPFELDGGRSAVQFDYTYEQDGERVVGRGFALYKVARAPVGLMFAAETQDQADLDERFALLVENVNLFDIDALRRQWTYLPAIIENVSYPRPMSWTVISNEGGDWVRYQPEDGSSFVAVSALDIQGDDPELLLGTVVSEYVAPGTVDFVAGEVQTYHIWTAQSYTAERDDQDIVGRVYITHANDRVYSLWGETPDAAIIADVVEPMLDGFQIEEVVAEPDRVGSDLVPINAETDDAPGLLLRYDRRSLVFYNRLPESNIDLSGLTFVQIPAQGAPIVFRTSEFTVGDLDALVPRDCFQVWTLFYTSLPANRFPAEICDNRQGFRQTVKSFWLSEDLDATFEVRRNGETLGVCPVSSEIDFDEFSAGVEDLGDETRCVIDLR